MPTYKVKARMSAVNTYTIEADSLEDALATYPDGQCEEGESSAEILAVNLEGVEIQAEKPKRRTYKRRKRRETADPTALGTQA